MMVKAYQREAEIKRLHGNHGINLYNIRIIIIVTIQTIAPFGSAIW
jgi:hypothetical protein